MDGKPKGPGISSDIIGTHRDTHALQTQVAQPQHTLSIRHRYGLRHSHTLSSLHERAAVTKPIVHD